MNLTNHESIAIKTIVAGCLDLDKDTAVASDYEGCYCDTDISDIAESCGITINQAKGVFGSLIKKGFAYQHGEEYGYMINLTESGFGAYKSSQ